MVLNINIYLVYLEMFVYILFGILNLIRDVAELHSDKKNAEINVMEIQSFNSLTAEDVYFRFPQAKSIKTFPNFRKRIKLATKWYTKLCD